MRNLIAASLERGKVDLTIYVENVASEATVRLNVSALRAYKADVEQAAAELGIPSPADWYTVLMRFPDVIKSETPARADDNEVEAVMTALSKAIEALMAYRRTEGEKLETFFAERIDRISELLAQVPQYETERGSAYAHAWKRAWPRFIMLIMTAAVRSRNFSSILRSLMSTRKSSA